MITIKIESNPYKKNISYYLLDETTQEYIAVEDDSANSKLRNNEFKNCFLPFKAKDILHQIKAEYGDNLKIIFDGPDEEFDELKQVQKLSFDRFNTINLHQGVKFLENGYTVIKEIKDIFKKIEPIINNSVEIDDTEIKQVISQYRDVSNDTIPICIIGNTNMGKSTFINALLGAEYLPQDKDRCTAKIYKIAQSEQSNSITVKFRYQENPVEITINKDIIIEGKLPKEFKNEIQTKLINPSLTQKTNTLLEYLNLYNETNQESYINQLIELIVPFNSKVLQSTDNKYIIFDTPGSNFDNNDEDLKLVQDLMKTMTNGLIIYISDYSGLSTTDNKNLINELRSFTNIDQRFTILAINKADSINDLKETEWNVDAENKTLNQTVPREIANVGLQGIFFVSSWFGLGYKNGGSFVDKYASEVYARNVRDFDNSDPHFTKRLYKFNILPIQLKQDVNDDIDPVYLNSGLYSIEKAIDTYASRYSTYNKCTKSYELINEIITKTNKKIEKATTEIEIKTEEFKSLLAKKKKELIDNLQKAVFRKRMDYGLDWNEKTKKEIVDINNKIYFTTKELAEREENIFKSKSNELRISELKTNVDKAWEDVNISEIWDKGKGLKKVWEDIKTYLSKDDTLDQKQKEAAIASYNKSIEVFSEEFYKKATSENSLLFNHLKNYSDNYSDILRQELSKIITDSDALTQNDKDRLCGKIAEYQQIKNKMPKFDDNQYYKYKRNWVVRFFSGNERIDVSKVELDFNTKMRQTIVKWFEESKENHINTFNSWANNLLNMITQDSVILENNPSLIELNNEKSELENRKQELENNRVQLNQYKNEIEEMINFSNK